MFVYWWAEYTQQNEYHKAPDILKTILVLIDESNAAVSKLLFPTWSRKQQQCSTSCHVPQGWSYSTPFFSQTCTEKQSETNPFFLGQHSSPTHLTCQGQVAADHTLPKEVDASGVNVPRHCSVPKGLKVKDFSKVAWKQKHLFPRAFLI